MPASPRWAAVIGVGAPVNGSLPDAVFGNAITSRIDSAPASSAHIRSNPNAIPPCGGGPMVHRGPAACPVRLEHRRVHHPDELPAALVDQLAPLADLQPGRAE